MLSPRLCYYHRDRAFKHIFDILWHLVVVEHVDKAIKGSNQTWTIFLKEFVLVKYYYKFGLPHLLEDNFQEVWHSNNTYIISCVFVTSHVDQTYIFLVFDMHVGCEGDWSVGIPYLCCWFVSFHNIDIVWHELPFAFHRFSQYPIKGSRLAYTCQSYQNNRLPICLADPSISSLDNCKEISI